jgi:hypothetical protein
MFFPHFPEMSNGGLLKMQNAVRESLETDDMLRLSGLKPIYGVRELNDWKPWSDALESELTKRKVKFMPVAW